jgi:conjugative relaxase-like TrwC/TraI family protein
MLRITQSVSAEGAAKYFDNALKASDYYVKGEDREQGVWGGRAAEALGLEGAVTREAFVDLVNNRVPGTQERLTVRDKDQRRPGYNFCFSVPKSVSVYHAISGDYAVQRIVEEAVRTTMEHVEARMETRVRGKQAKGRDHDRITGNLVYAAFTHMVTRPIDGIPDPHLHVHCYVANVTFDAVENRWKAGQFGNLKADAPFYEAAFHTIVAEKLSAAGYGIRRTQRNFELASVSQSLVEKFSKRTHEIEKLAKEKFSKLEARALVEQTGMEFEDAFAEVKSKLGGESRESKQSERIGPTERRMHWLSEMTPVEKRSLSGAAVKGAPSEQLLEPGIARQLAIDELFERRSLVRELQAAAMLLRRGIGRVSVLDAEAFAKSEREFVRPDPGGRLVTTREVLTQEEAMIEKALSGQGTCEELARGAQWKYVAPAISGSEEHRAVVEHLLKNTDAVTAIHGPAGSGKTTMMREAVNAIETLSGKCVQVYAPSSAAVKVLKGEGFTHADTFRQLQQNDIVQDAARRQVIWVDEAGFLSVRQMHWLVDFALKNDSRVILSGDTKQHHSVERGDALRIMERAGAVTQAALSKIFRQQVPALRAAIEDLSQGRTQSGFDKLDKFGAVLEVEDKKERLATIATTHMAAVKEGKSSLVVAPTHGECRAVAAAVRKLMKEQSLLLSQEDKTLTTLRNLNLTESERRDPIHYESGQVVEFNKMCKGGFKSGQQWEVARCENGEVVVERSGEERRLPLENAKKFNLYGREQIAVAVGDQIRVTKNFQCNGQKFRNNELLTVSG